MKKITFLLQAENTVADLLLDISNFWSVSAVPRSPDNHQDEAPVRGGDHLMSRKMTSIFQGYLLLLASALHIYMISVGLLAHRKLSRQEGRMHSVKITENRLRIFVYYP